MNLNTLQIIKNELIQRKLIAETNLTSILSNTTVLDSDKINDIIYELDNIKNMTLLSQVWDSYIESNIIMPDKQDDGSNN
jgi:hypothetical protein